MENTDVKLTGEKDIKICHLPNPPRYLNPASDTATLAVFSLCAKLAGCLLELQAYPTNMRVASI